MSSTAFDGPATDGADGRLRGRATAISLTVNDEYATPAVVLLESLRGNLPAGIELIVRDTGLSASSRMLIAKQADRSQLTPSFLASAVDDFRGANLLGHWTDPAAFARISPYESDHRFVLDLDVDLLVRRPLHDLLASVPTNDATLAAVPSHHTTKLWSEEVGSTDDLPVRDSDSYFMGGVYVIDTSRWAAITVDAKSLFSSNPGRWKSELSLLNVICARLWSPLERRWNVWTLARRGPFRYVRVDGATTRAIARSDEVAVAHFPGHFKAWLSHYPMNRWRSEYRRTWRRSVLAGKDARHASSSHRPIAERSRS